MEARGQQQLSSSLLCTLFFKDLFVCVCGGGGCFVCTPCACNACKGQKRMSLWNCRYRRLLADMLMLGTEPRSSARSGSAIYCWAISSPFALFFEIGACCSTCLGTRHWTWVFILSWQVPSQLSHLPSHVELIVMFLKTREFFSHIEIKGLMGGMVEQVRIPESLGSCECRSGFKKKETNKKST